MYLYNLPKISCLLLTHPVHNQDRFDLFKKSVYCYLSQTYKNKELVILNEGPKEYQEKIYSYIKNLNRSDIHCEFLNGKYTLGGLRNISIDIAHGDIFVQWDDDDFCTPERLSVQFRHLFNSTAVACFLTDQLHYFFDTQEIYWDNWLNGSGGQKKYSLIPGTIMAYKKADIKYPHLPRKEDTVMTDELVTKKEITLLSGYGYMHVYTFHGGNLWEQEHHMAITAHRGNEIDFIFQHRFQITRTLEFLDIANSIKVFGKDKLAFIYKK